jgi:hypothetical protein
MIGMVEYLKVSIDTRRREYSHKLQAQTAPTATAPSPKPGTRADAGTRGWHKVVKRATRKAEAQPVQAQTAPREDDAGKA